MALPCHRGVDSGVFPRSLISGPGWAVTVTSAALLGRVLGPHRGWGSPRSGLSVAYLDANKLELEFRLAPDRGPTVKGPSRPRPPWRDS